MPAQPLSDVPLLHIWRAPLDGPGRPGAERLPAEERARAERIIPPAARRRWVASRWALREVLSGYLGEPPERIALRQAPRGKPELAGRGAELRFNLSHSRGLALVAVARGMEVGVDLERIDAGRKVDVPAWARREAIAKCFGVGLDGPLPDAPVAVAEIDAGPGFAAAVAVAGEELPPLRHLALDIAS